MHTFGGSWPRPVATVLREDLPRKRKIAKMEGERDKTRHVGRSVRRSEGAEEEGRSGEEKTTPTQGTRNNVQNKKTEQKTRCEKGCTFEKSRLNFGEWAKIGWAWSRPLPSMDTVAAFVTTAQENIFVTGACLPRRAIREMSGLR